MPIKWSSDVDHVLLLKILEVHDIHVDTKAIAEKWPTELEKPTPRAISERLVKLRSLVKKAGNGDGHFAIKQAPPKSPRTPSSVRRPRTTPATGRKKRVSKVGQVKHEYDPMESTELLSVKREPEVESSPTNGTIFSTPKSNDGQKATASPSAGAVKADSGNHPATPNSPAIWSMDGSLEETPTARRGLDRVTRGKRISIMVSDDDAASFDDSDISDFGSENGNGNGNEAGYASSFDEDDDGI